MTMSRETPRAFELMPEMLGLLQRNQEQRTGEIAKALQPFMAQRGYRDRPYARGFALRYLQREGYIRSPRRGIWCITPEGQAARIDEDWGRRITDKYEKR